MMIHLEEIPEEVSVDPLSMEALWLDIKRAFPLYSKHSRTIWPFPVTPWVPKKELIRFGPIWREEEIPCLA
jgi:hypothetical protein